MVYERMTGPVRVRVKGPVEEGKCNAEEVPAMVPSAHTHVSGEGVRAKGPLIRSRDAVVARVTVTCLEVKLPGCYARKNYRSPLVAGAAS